MKVFWSKKAKEFLDWDKDWDSTSNVDYHQGLIEWFKGGKLKIPKNCFFYGVIFFKLIVVT
jgi:hypothetical protein